MEQQSMYLGNFEVTSGELITSDPCYDLDTWCMGVLKGVKKGSWHAYSMIEDSEERNSALIIYHESVSKTDASYYFSGAYKLNTAPFEVGVDSGQAGFFDSTVYKNDATVPTDFNLGLDWKDRGWYGMCARLTLSDKGAGVVPGGAVSSSGYGDGGYSCRYFMNENHEIIYADIVFIGEDDNEEDDD